MAKEQTGIGEKAKRIEIALKFTNGDMEKAKLMASGGLLDVTVIKGKFIVADQELSGFFLGYINTLGEYISAVRSVVVSNNSIFTRIRIFDEWKLHYKNLLAYKKGDDSVNSDRLDSDLLSSFIKHDIFPDVQKENLDYLSGSIPEMIRESFKSGNVKCQLDLEKTSSLDLVLAGIDIMLPEPVEEQPVKEAEPADIKPAADTGFSKKLSDIESKAQYVVEGCLVLSPVRGKLISEVSQGERIYVMLPGKDPVSQKVLDAYKARNEEGNPLPIVGRVLEKIPNELTKGLIIYVVIAKGIYAKITEEENMKVQTELTASSQKSEDDEGSSSKKKMMTWALYVVFVFLIIALVVILARL